MTRTTPSQKGLLTIGEVAKLANTSLKSLRYYEKIGLLKPVEINPETGYRFYSPNQMNLVWLIRYCVDLGIPLKKLLEFFNDKNSLDYQQVLAFGKAMALEKMAYIQKGLSFIEFSEREFLLTSRHPLNEIYHEDVVEKYYYVVPHYPELGEAGSIRAATQMQNAVKELQPEDGFDVSEWGYYYEFSKTGTQRYLFMELHTPLPETGSLKVIPAGRYTCIQLTGDHSKLELAPDLFKTIFAEPTTVIAIERLLYPPSFDMTEFRLEIRVLPK